MLLNLLKGSLYVPSGMNIGMSLAWKWNGRMVGKPCERDAGKTMALVPAIAVTWSHARACKSRLLSPKSTSIARCYEKLLLTTEAGLGASLVQMLRDLGSAKCPRNRKL